MADRAGSRGSGHGINGTVLEARLASAGTVLEAELPEAGRGKSPIWNAASGAGAIESWAAGAQERLFGRRTTGEAAGGTGADLELCTRYRTAPLADGDAQKVPADVRPGAVAEPTGGSAGRRSEERRVGKECRSRWS